jgi:DNA-binding transcriptional regulator YiaG
MMHDDAPGLGNPLEKPYPRRCGECGQVAIFPTLIARDGQLHRFHMDALHIDTCQNCGEEFFTNRTDEQISAGLRSHLGLLQPEEIRTRLAELGLSQADFASRMGVGAELVSRWINGLVIQTRALDNLMRVFFGFESVREVLAASGPPRTLGLPQSASAGGHSPDPSLAPAHALG